MDAQIIDTTTQIPGLNTPGQYVILHGEAPKDFYQKQSRHTGVITAPADFFLKKHTLTYAANNQQLLEFCTEFPYHDMLCTYSIKDGRITFIENNSTDLPGATVIGEIIINNDLKALNINKNYKYTTQQLADVLKFNRRLFADADQCMQIVTSLKNFSAEIIQRVEAIDDKQGTKVNSYMHKVSHEVQLSFVLSLPLILGHQAHCKFKVDIHFDLRDKAVEFWLESVELKENLEDLKISIINREIDRFEKLIPIIEIE